MELLAEFCLRLTFGLALAMALTPPSKVNSGFFRNHSYVLLGLSVLALLAARPLSTAATLWGPAIAMAASYFSSAFWLYEKPRLGIGALAGVAAASLIGAWSIHPAIGNSSLPIATGLRWLDPATGGFLLGTTFAAMFLGHWYLNSPTMEIEPLRRLLWLLVAALVLRSLQSGTGLWLEWNLPDNQLSWSLLALRWFAGIGGAAGIVWMAWQTLKIPNTQSATGILYVGVVFCLLGEITSLLLSQQTSYPV